MLHRKHLGIWILLWKTSWVDGSKLTIAFVVEDMTG
jgi:hypothetical protein